MANNCAYDMNVYAKDKETLERFGKILRYEDDEFYIYRVFSAEMYDSDEEDGMQCMQFCGDVAWSAGSWVYDEPDFNCISKLGAHYSNLQEISKALGLTIEVYSEECDEAFGEHFVVDEGDLVLGDSCEYHDWWVDEPADIDDFVENCNYEIPEETVKKLHDVLSEPPSGGMSVQIGGYDWHFNHYKDIKERNIVNKVWDEARWA